LGTYNPEAVFLVCIAEINKRGEIYSGVFSIAVVSQEKAFFKFFQMHVEKLIVHIEPGMGESFDTETPILGY